MSSSAYEILSMLMRYLFVLIGVLIVFRAYRWLRRDARAYRREMRALPDAGLVGEIVDLNTGEAQPLPREGTIGSARECDIRVKDPGALRVHARFAFEEGRGLQVTPLRQAKMLLGGEPLNAPRHALHGTQLQIGDTLLRVRLFAGLNVPMVPAFPADPNPDDVPDPDFDWNQGDTIVDDFHSFLPPNADPNPDDVPDPAVDWNQGDTINYMPPASFPLPGVEADQADENPGWENASFVRQQVQPAPGSVPGYDGGYTEDGQMTWQYAYSLEDLYRAQAAQASQQQPPDGEEAFPPYHEPPPRRRRRSRR